MPQTAPSKSSASDSEEEDDAPLAANIKSSEIIADDSSDDDDIPLARRVPGAAPAVKKEGKPVTNGSKVAMATNGKADKRKIEVKQEDSDEDSDVPLVSDYCLSALIE